MAEATPIASQIVPRSFPDALLRASPRARDWAGRIGIGFSFSFLATSVALRAAGLLHVDAGIGLDAGLQLLAFGLFIAFYVLMIGLSAIRLMASHSAAGVQPRVSAILGTYLALGLGAFPRHADLAWAWHLASFALILCGMAIVLTALPRLGRSFSLMAEARALVTEGPYRIVRHPLYLGEEIVLLGAFIPVASVPAALLLLAQIGFQVLRIRNEEAVLARAFPDYTPYARPRARLIPGLW